MKNITLILLSTLVPSSFFAMDADKLGPVNNADSTVIELDSVLVIAQHREQRLLDVPIAISTVNSQTLEQTHTRTFEELSAFIPGLNVTVQTPHRPSLSIRGLTSDEVSPTAQPRVSVYFNNVPTSRASMALTELYDMDRVEVMKGPQGTLFGRGSQIGAISFITKKPVPEFGGYLSAGFGSYGMQSYYKKVKCGKI